MIHCLVCGRWVCKTHNADRELQHLDRCFPEVSKMTKGILDYFEVVRI